MRSDWKKKAIEWVIEIISQWKEELMNETKMMFLIHKKCTEKINDRERLKIGIRQHAKQLGNDAKKQKSNKI